MTISPISLEEISLSMLLYTCLLISITDFVDHRHGDGPFFAGLDDSVADFFGVERLSCTVVFHDQHGRHFNRLVSSKPSAAAHALPAAANRPVVRRTGNRSPCFPYSRSINIS